MTPPIDGGPALSRETILAELDRILGSALFVASERSSTLLRFLVHHTLDKDAARLKEYTIGADGLGKGSSFDPRTDPIVRAEASRLRTRLEKYYGTEGQSDPLVITLPKGSYVPQFQVRPEASIGAARAGKASWLPSERLVWFSVGMIVAACALIFVSWGYSRMPREETPLAIAVLPFANMSGDTSQDFFSDGMAEEIDTALAKIPDLRVVARTSAFQFKNQNRDVHTIAQALHATHLVEGSVRKAGTRLRITAQLVRATDGVNVWSNSYDRELTDIFAIQEEIATAVATALRMPLGLKPGEHLVSNRPKDQETYELYLRGRVALRARSRQELDLLEQVVTRDPNFAPGWAKLSEARRETALDFQRRGEDSNRPVLLEGAETAAKKAIALDAGYAGGYAALAGIYYWRGKWTEAIGLAKQGLALDPEEPELLNNYAETLHALGYLKDALRVREQLALLEPFDALYNRHTAELMLANGNFDAGVKALEALHGAAIANAYLAEAYASRGRFAEAADALLEMPMYQDARPLRDAAVEGLRSVANKGKAPSNLPVLEAEFSFVYGALGVPERMLDWPENAVSDGDYRPLGFAWWPTPTSVRQSERFKALLREAGLVDYWRAHGWPDLCHPVGAGDFACS